MASCLLHTGGEELGFRDLGKQLLRAALAILRLSRHHPLLTSQRFQALLVNWCQRLLSCFHLPWRKSIWLLCGCPGSFSQLEMLVAIALSWLAGRCSQLSVATDAFPVLLHPPLGGTGWTEWTWTLLMSLSLHCTVIRE